MLTLIEKIRSGYLWDFPGGIHPTENKQQSVKSKIGHAHCPAELIVPVKQHIGKPGDLLVKVGDLVKKGQPLTHYSSTFMLPVHAPTSGLIKAIEDRPSAHPSAISELSIVIESDGLDSTVQANPVTDYSTLSSESVIDIIRDAGIAGLGGAGFPTAKKVQSGLARTDILIINGAECEPYITADDSLMREYADSIIDGISVLEHILKPKLTIVAIEDNKPKAIEAMSLAAKQKDIVIRAIPTKYPSGGEKQLIKILTNQEVPVGGIPADLGIVVHNVGSIYAIKQAVIDGLPLTERVVTLTGQAFPKPQNVWVKIGTPIQSLLDQYGYQTKKGNKIILGGPMMGYTLPHAHIPVTKTVNCVLAPKKRELLIDQTELACIRCGECAEVCPVSLLPQEMQWYAKDHDLDKCEEFNIKDCIECGACAYVCPSNIPLVHYYRQAKTEIKVRNAEAQAAERAKIRFEERNLRLERDKAEREAKFQKAAEARKNKMAESNGDDAIAAAIERVKAKSKPSDGEKKPAVAAAIARAKAKQAAAQKNDAKNAVPDNSEMAKLREERKQQARLKKSQSDKATDGELSSSKPKSDAVAAAIARAKARKAQQEQPSSVDTESAEPVNETPVVDTQQAAKPDKKAAVAAAIARAKARKAQQEQSSVDTESAKTDSEEIVSETSFDDTQQTVKPDKKAAVAAAIARAKARKADQELKKQAQQKESE
jgi:electron transport complex protein RnfC